MLLIHVIAGSLALIAGFIALHARKGGPTHVSAGRAFGAAMIVMTLSAGIMAMFMRPNPGNAIAASMTLYLVTSSWLAVRLGPDRAPRRYVAMTATAMVIAACAAAVAGIAWQAPGRVLSGIPAGALIMFTGVMLIALIGDLRVLRSGHLKGPSRILRHLWRMGFAVWIAFLSFFIGQADEFPAAVRQSGVLFVPVLLVTATFLYWVMRQGWTVLRARRAGAVPPAGAGERRMRVQPTANEP